MASPCRVAPPPPPIRKGQVVAFEAVKGYKAKKTGELTIEEGDLLFILDQTDSVWWRARVDDREGLVPSKHLSTARVPIVEGARRGNLGLVEECLSVGVSPNALDKAGNSALHAAAQAGHVNCLQALLRTPGVLLDLQNKMGDTPLHCASFRGHDEVVRMLLQRGASQTIRNRDGFTARELGRRLSVVGAFDEALLRERGTRVTSYHEDEYGGGDSDSD